MLEQHRSSLMIYTEYAVRCLTPRWQLQIIKAGRGLAGILHLLILMFFFDCADQ